MATTKFYATGTLTNLLTTELNSLANGAAVTSAGFQNVNGSGLLGYTKGRLELNLGVPSAALAAGAINVWFLRSVSASDADYETAPPPRSPDATFFPAATASAQRLFANGVDVDLPAGRWKAYLQLTNLGGSVQLAATGNTLKVLPITTTDV